MIQISYPAIIVGVLIAFVVSTLYYIILNSRYKTLLGKKPEKNGKFKMAMTPNRILAELVRNFFLGIVIAYAVAMLNLLRLDQAILVAVWLWIGLPLVLLSGLVVHENYSKGLAAIHAGDWLLKLLIFSVLLTLWR
jgi:hypothetical protein